MATALRPANFVNLRSFIAVRFKSKLVIFLGISKELIVWWVCAYSLLPSVAKFTLSEI